MYLADEKPVSCPTCGHFVSYSAKNCGTCGADLSGLDLAVLAEEQHLEHSSPKGSFLFLAVLMVMSWAAIYFSA